MDYGVPVTLIAEAVFARCLSSLKEERMIASKILPGPSKNKSDVIKNKDLFLSQVGKVHYTIFYHISIVFILGSLCFKGC